MKKLLVDQVEQHLLEYFLQRGYSIGDTVPTENELSTELGVARSVLREALRGLKLIGLIKSRPRIGMTLAEPQIFSALGRILDPRFFTERTLLHMFEVRIMLEIGAAEHLVESISDEYLDELEKLVQNSKPIEKGSYDWAFEYEFHKKLYAYADNEMLSNFQSILYTAITFAHRENIDKLVAINNELAEQGFVGVEHIDIIHVFRKHDPVLAGEVLRKHFLPYRIFIENERKACTI